MLKLYADPASTTCRPILLFAADAGIELTHVPINLMAGETHSEAFARINPNQQVPVLDHDGFVLTESSAILKYLADLTESPAYPRELQARARVNQWMDWFVSGVTKDYVCGCVYPKVIPHHRLSEPANTERQAWHLARAERQLAVLDARLKESTFVCGPTMSLADYLGVGCITMGEAVDFDLSAYPNVMRWIAQIKTLRVWNEVNAVFDGHCRAFRAARAAAT